MALKDILLGKKKNTQSDGQEEYFKDDFPPIAKQPTKKAAESKPVVKEEKPATKKTESKKAEPNKADGKKAEVKKDTAKSDAPKTPTKTSKSSESRRVQPQPVDRIVNPKNVKTAKTTATKPTDDKKTVKSAEKTTKSSAKATKPAEKAAKPTSKTAKPVSQSTTKATKIKELNDNSPEVKGAVAVEESSTTSNGKWDIRRAKDGRYFFSLYASNHTVIAYSQIYSSSSAVMTGINSVISNAPVAETEDTTLKKPVSLPCPKWEIYLDKAGEYRFRLYAPNGLVVCHASHGYSSKSGCKGGIESIKRFCTEADIKKSY